MVFSPRNPGPTGPHFMSIPSSDETNATANHKTAKHTRMPIPQSTAYAYGHLAPHLLSPPQDAEQLQPAKDDASAFNKCFGNTVPPNFEHGHPSTPPRLKDDIQLLQMWNAQNPNEHHASTSTSHHDIVNPFSVFQHQQLEATNQHYIHGHNNPTGPFYQDVFMKQNSCVSSLRNAQRHGHRARDAIAPLEVYPGRHSGSLFHHAGTQSPYDAPLMQQPPVQQWPTHRLGKPSRGLSPPQHRARSSSNATAMDPSPGHDGVTLPDKKVLEKAEAYRRKGEELRRHRQSRVDSRPPPPNPPTSGSVKRKAVLQPSDDISPTLAPFLRHPPPPYGQPSMYSTGYGDRAPDPPPHFDDTRILNGYASHIYTFDPSLVHQPRLASTSHDLSEMIPTLGQHQPLAHQQSVAFTPEDLPQMLPSHLQGKYSHPSLPFRPSSAFQYSLMSQPDSLPPVIPEPKPVDWDDLPQEIVPDYGDYKWPVTHYEVVSSGTYGAYEFAQSWLDDLYAANNLLAPRSRWHRHSTQGFIEGGTGTSFIVLHNAVNPFEHDDAPSSTTSIGVYGYDWYDHTTIHWTTFAPDIRSLLRYCESEARNIRVNQRWTVDMPKAREKRFHRAYWLAATRSPLGNLLKRGPSNDLPHDAVENDEPFEFTEEDLSNEWNNTFEESEEAWERIKEDIELIGDKCITSCDHVVTGSSEWE
jgi:hypothetical protein